MSILRPIKQLNPNPRLFFLTSAIFSPFSPSLPSPATVGGSTPSPLHSLAPSETYTLEGFIEFISEQIAFLRKIYPSEPRVQQFVLYFHGFWYGKMKDGGASLDMYNYVRADASAINKAIDVHDVFVKRSGLRLFFSYIGRLFLLANILLLLTEKDKFSIGSFWRLFLGVTFAKLLQYKPIKRESVVIMPSFGVQLETHYWSGKIDRKFIPMGTILKAVLNECVTPVTCYWSLSLLLQDKDQLMLVFQKLKPPIKILVPVWRALCKAIDLENLSH